MSTITDPGLHRRHHLLGHDHRRLGTREQHAADHGVRLAHALLEGEPVRHQRDDPALVDLVDEAELVEVLVDHDHLRLHPRRDPRGVRAGHPGTEDEDARRPHARDATEQHAAAARLLLEESSGHVRGHPAGDLAHRREEREAAVDELDRLVGDRLDLPTDQLIRERGVRREVEIGEEDLPFPHRGVLRRDRFLDLQDHVGAAPDVLGGRHELRSRPLVALLGEARAERRSFLDQDRVSGVDELAHPFRGGRDPELVVLDLFGDADDHARPSPWPSRPWPDLGLGLAGPPGQPTPRPFGRR